MKRKLAVMLTVALIPLSGTVACQAVEDRARDEVNKQVENGKQRINEEIDKGQKRVEKEIDKGQKQAEDGAQNVQKEVEKRTGGGQ